MENVVIDTKAIDNIWKKYVKNLEELNPRYNIEYRGYHIEEILPKEGVLFLCNGLVEPMVSAHIGYPTHVRIPHSLY